MKNGACPSFGPRRAAHLEALRDERFAGRLNGAAADVHPVREGVDVVEVRELILDVVGVGVDDGLGFVTHARMHPPRVAQPLDDLGGGVIIVLEPVAERASLRGACGLAVERNFAETCRDVFDDVEVVGDVACEREPRQQMPAQIDGAIDDNDDVEFGLAVEKRTNLAFDAVHDRLLAGLGHLADANRGQPLTDVVEQGDRRHACLLVALLAKAERQRVDADGYRDGGWRDRLMVDYLLEERGLLVSQRVADSSGRSLHRRRRDGVPRRSFEKTTGAFRRKIGDRHDDGAAKVRQEQTFDDAAALVIEAARPAIALAAIEPTLDANGPTGRVVGPLESPNGAPCHAVDIDLVFFVAVLLGGRDNELRQLVGLLEDGRERLTRRLRIARLRQRRLRRPERTQRGFDNGTLCGVIDRHRRRGLHAFRLRRLFLHDPGYATAGEGASIVRPIDVVSCACSGADLHP